MKIFQLSFIKKEILKRNNLQKYISLRVKMLQHKAGLGKPEQRDSLLLTLNRWLNPKALFRLSLSTGNLNFAPSRAPATLSQGLSNVTQFPYSKKLQ